MFKKVFIFLFFLIIVCGPAFADINPTSVKDINKNSIGLYEPSNRIKLYAQASEDSQLLADVSWSASKFNSQEISPEDLFLTFIPKKRIAIIEVLDMSNDGKWLKINFKGGIAWIKMLNRAQYMNWPVFFDFFGRLYPPVYLRESPDNAYNFYSKNSPDSLVLGKTSNAKRINIFSVNGNWYKTRIKTEDGTYRDGWIMWKNSGSGAVYLYPGFAEN